MHHDILSTMKTKYVISGGNSKDINKENDMFFSETLKDTPVDAKVLIIMFAKMGNGVERSYEAVKHMFERNKAHRKISYTMAVHSKLSNQISEAQVVYIYGGDNLGLIHEMKRHSDFESLVRGKIVAAESAGAYFLSSIFYSKTIGEITKGRGILPIKIICHFVGLHEEKLDSISRDLEKVLLKDYEHKVYIR